jgi:hypothetical protein
MLTMNDDKGFNCTWHGQGFHMTFANGWTASVQWGEANYCENRFKKGTFPSCDAEIAAWKGDKWHRFETDTVKGWVKPEQVAEFLLEVSIKR